MTMATKPPTLPDLYRALHQIDAEILACRPGRIGSRWWNARVAARQRLRSEINGLVQRRPGSSSR
jgi:hypothetical protein